MVELQIIQLCDLLEEFGEEPVSEVLAEFLCEKNKDVEYFIKNKAILYEKMDKSRTYLIFTLTKSKMYLVAYFTLCSRPIIFDETISNKRKKQILGTGYEANSQLSGILIGQFGKNYNEALNLVITGKDLYDLALHKVLQANKLIGGRIVYLECEDSPKLREFYESVGLELYEDDKGNPILNDNGLLTYLISTRNINVDKKSNRERINNIIITS